MRYKSCYWLEEGLSFDRDSIKLCCLYSPKGGGNTIIYDNWHGEPVDWEKIFEAKKKIKDIFKSGGMYPNCEGCVSLKEDDWRDDHSKVTSLNLDYWTKCYSKCIYCYTMHDKEKNNSYKNYNLLPILKDMIEKDILRPYGHVSFGGGEATLLEEFEEILEIFIDMGFPLIRIHTDAIKYSKAIEKGLEKGCIDLIISVDAGTGETHKKVKQINSYDTVWKNLREYAKHQQKPDGVKTKYIVIPDINDNIEEIKLWLEKSKENGINFVFQDIEGCWFIDNRDKPNQHILELFEKTKLYAEQLGLTYSLYEKSTQMTTDWSKEAEQ